LTVYEDGCAKAEKAEEDFDHKFISHNGAKSPKVRKIPSVFYLTDSTKGHRSLILCTNSCNQ